MAPKLFYDDLSPAVRGTLLTIKALGIEVEMHPVNLMAGEHLQPSFIKMNPLHTVPTLEDGNFHIWDSHVINNYLTSKYGNNDSLYPKDIEKRAIIEQRLHFDTGILFPRVGAIMGSVLRKGSKTIDKEMSDLLIQGYSSFETLLQGKTYVAGDELSVADFSLIATASSANVLVPIAPEKFPNISNWMSRMEKLPYYKEANQVGLDKYTAIVRSKLG